MPIAIFALAAGAALAQVPARTFEVHIAARHVPAAERVLRAAQGERLELRWSSDEPLLLHLHGYNIEARVEPGRTTVMAFTARSTGRFPVEIHGDRTKRQSHALLYLEIYPR